MALGSVAADRVLLLPILFRSSSRRVVFARSVVPRVLEAEKYRAVVVCSKHELWIDLSAIDPRSR
jgi:hypothetical protein